MHVLPYCTPWLWPLDQLRSITSVYGAHMLFLNAPSDYGSKPVLCVMACDTGTSTAVMNEAVRSINCVLRKSVQHHE